MSAAKLLRVARVWLVVLALFAATGRAHATPPSTPTTAATRVFYFSPDWQHPHAHVETGAGWSAPPGRALAPVAGRPGWWSANVPGVVHQMVFHDPERGAWDNPGRQPGANYRTPGVPTVWVKDGRVSSLPPENVRPHVVPAPTLGRDARRDVTVILPPGFDPGSGKRYPVVYLLDGQNVATDDAPHGGWQADQALGTEVQQRRAQPVIIVGIHAGDRMKEYTPVADAKHGGGAEDRFLDFVGRDLVPWVDAHYPTLSGVDNRALAGSSLGGLATLHALAKRPDLFTKGIVFSPSVWWSNRAILDEVRASPAVSRAKIFLYHGGAKDGGADSQDLERLLRDKGLARGQHLFYEANPEGEHDEAAWRGVLPRALDRMFPTEGSATGTAPRAPVRIPAWERGTTAAATP